MTKQPIIILFLDGVGLGDADLEVNPFMQVELPTLQSLLGVPHLTREAAGTVTNQAALLGLDARLGVAGLPQSATGQTTILTGQNASQHIGEHSGPYPNAPLRALLKDHSIFRTLVAAGQRVAYANAYPRRFLDRLARGKGRLSANTQAARLAGLKLRTGDDLRRGRALSALMSNEFWPEPDFRLPPLSTYDAGRQLVALANDYSLTFFEFWYSDLLGHKQDRDQSLKILRVVDDFLAGVVADLDGLLIVVSDHGNFEDWTTNKHTLNPALTLLYGEGFQTLVPKLHSLADVKAVIVERLD